MLMFFNFPMSTTENTEVKKCVRIELTHAELQATRGRSVLECLERTNVLFLDRDFFLDLLINPIYLRLLEIGLIYK